MINFRVCVPPEHFLVVVYSPLHSKPEFYEFSTCDGKPDLQVSLFTSHALLNLPSVSRNLEQTCVWCILIRLWFSLIDHQWCLHYCRKGLTVHLVPLNWSWNESQMETRLICFTLHFMLPKTYCKWKLDILQHQLYLEIEVSFCKM